MKKKRLILIVCSCLCVVFAGVVMAIAISYTSPQHRHVLGKNKTYHICNDHIYYTRVCQDGCDVAFETKATLTDVFTSVTEEDDIILDEDVSLTEELFIKSFVGTGNDVKDLELNINLDLNNFTLSINVDETENDTMFMFNANRGKINFNISNGKISSQDTSYIFRFKNTTRSGDNIKLNIDNVECLVSGIKATPLFAHDCVNIEVNANNSKFISNTTTSNTGDYGVGVFINSDSQFNFTNCYFEGGDAVYVKDGTVNLTGCKLVNEGLVQHPTQGVETLFSAVGACLTADSHTTSKDITTFIITIKDCEMESRSSYKMIYVIETAYASGVQVGVDDKSIIDVQSCAFNNDPTWHAIPQYELVQYPNGEAPQNYGTQTWICGNIASEVDE
ncbi:MAG: hypothetical protein J6Q15_01575 [Clostridia bacterium]|nr:hypothetical protein [Clostridia bacterium]